MCIQCKPLSHTGFQNSPQETKTVVEDLYTVKNLTDDAIAWLYVIKCSTFSPLFDETLRHIEL